MFLFRAHVFSLGLKGDVCFFLPFLERGCNFSVGKTTKKRMKHSWHSFLMDFSNKNMNFTDETHPCGMDSIC